MKEEKLKKLMDIFIEGEEWEEVSRLQYELDTLIPEKKEIKVEQWIITSFNWYVLNKLLAHSYKVEYMCEKFMEENNE